MGTTSVAWLSEVTVARQLILLGCVVIGFWGCKPKNDQALLTARETFAELRVVKGQVSIAEVGKSARVPYPRERLGEGASLTLQSDSLVYLRDDHGATWLLAGPAQAKITKQRVELASGKAFIDTQGGPAVSLGTTQGGIEVSEGRSSITVAGSGSIQAYALRGSVRHAAMRAVAGEMLILNQGHAPETRKITAWTDWTAGLATADPSAQPAPYGIGTVGARVAGDSGKPRFPLVIQRLEVRVKIDRDYAQTEVDETFVNPSAQDVEGLFSFRVPQNAVLHRFGVDRDGLLVWGRTQEKRSAAAQYQSNVYEGSTEDPALLEWVQRGSYQARLYPIAAGTTRRVVTRYGEWLARDGQRGERRLYVYPMAATGAEGTLPRIEEMTIRIDWSKALARTVRAPVGTVSRGKQLILKRFDILPKADIAVELFDAGRSEQIAYRAKHALGEADAPFGADVDFAQKTSEEEPDYLLLPLVPPKFEEPPPGLDLALVVDGSAAMDSAALAVSRSLVDAILTALGPTDRAALWTGDTTLRPVLAESGQLTQLDESRRKTWLAALANAPLGGATDLGTMLAEAAERLEPKRRGAVIYVGDGRPSVGELLPKPLHERLARLPATARIFAVGVGSQVNAALLSSLVRGAPLETVENGYEAAQAALRLLEAATLSSWNQVTVQLVGADRLLPRRIPTAAAGEPALVVGRVAGPMLGDKLELVSPTTKRGLSLRIVALDDDGDLRRRWGEERLQELVEQQSGRLAIVDLARRYGLVTPWTSFYVPTKREVEESEGQYERANALSPDEERRAETDRLTRWRPWSLMLSRDRIEAINLASEDRESLALAQQQLGESQADSDEGDQRADNKEGGTGTRAKGEEGSMGHRSKRYAVAGPQEPTPAVARAAALREAKEFGMSGLLPKPSRRAAAAAAPSPAEPAKAKSQGWASSESPAAAIDEPPSPMDSPNVAPPSAPDDASATAKSTSRARPGRGRLGGSPAASAPRVQLGKPSVEDATTDVASAFATSVPSKAPTTASASAAPNASATSVPSKAPNASVKPAAPLAQLSHELLPCSAASDLPLPERRKLWLERLSGNVTVESVREIYANAIRGCEASTWFERQHLLFLMVQRLSSVKERVQLYQSFYRSPAAAAVIYRAILVRIQDAKALREFHEALGVKRASPEMVQLLLRRANGLADQARLLRGLVNEWPDDLELMLKLLEVYEDGGDWAAARALARKLRRRADASAHVRTLVGEFYWRCSEREHSADQTRDLEEARRAFGEIVEFAPEDPEARRRLGDLLRAHGWYEEALRQYETLRELLPDDPTVHLLIAGAAQGIGKTEEALRWSEKAAATAAPDGQNDLERAAQATSAAYLAWAREDAIKAGQLADAKRLLLRGQKLSSSVGEVAGPIRFILTWEHPELHPTMYGLTDSGAVPSRQMSSLGVAEQYAAKDEPRVELRLDPEDVERSARLGAEVVLTAILADGTAEPRTARLRVHFGDAQHPKERVRIAYIDGKLREEAL